mmetsp:Transcript_5223/g.9211  ORF Transcript_5223/g.9211 Transcript_5223/m.9211 type:complete len:240 (-) Transcript_5223:149-868(-)
MLKTGDFFVYAWGGGTPLALSSSAALPFRPPRPYIGNITVPPPPLTTATASSLSATILPIRHHCRSSHPAPSGQGPFSLFPSQRPFFIVPWGRPRLRTTPGPGRLSSGEEGEEGEEGGQFPSGEEEEEGRGWARAARATFSKSSATLRGPRPPGAGAKRAAPAARDAAGSSRSPTSLSSWKLLPTQTTAAPGFTHSGFSRSGFPMHGIRMSALRHSASSNPRGVSAWARVTVAPSAVSM